MSMSFKMLSDTQKQAMLTASVDRSKIKDGPTRSRFRRVR